jgi:TonB-dependent starch-binding outer membrane protein SusC
MRKLLAFMLCMSIAVSQLMAQSRTVTGKVTDEKGLPLAAVTVTVLTGDRKVVSTGVTDLNGAFSLPVSERSRSLQFTYIGLEEQLVQLGGKSTFPVTLRANARNLSEVVVVGYGSQQKKDVTGSVVNVKGATIAEKPVQSFESALAGRSAGVQITVPSGVVNEPPVFRIRGTNSISLSSYPLIIVDGVPSYTGDFTSGNASANPLASINPNDIESIDIAKDAAATAIYGSRASNGVVFITTKKGRAGRLRVTYDGWAGKVTAYGQPHMMNAAQYLQFKTMAIANNQALTGYGLAYAKDAQGNNIDTRWADHIYRTGYSQSHTLSISGGNDNTTYYFSSGYTSQQGIIRRNEFDRANILFNMDTKINKWVSFGAKGSYSDEHNLAAAASGSLPGEAFSIIGLGRIGLVLPPILAAYNNDGTYNINGNTIGYPNFTGTGNTVGYYNPVPIIDLSRSNNEVNHIQASTYLQIKPLSWVTLKSAYSIDYLLVDNDIFSTPVTGDGYAATGSASDVFGKYKTWLWTNTAQFDYSFGGQHNFSLLVGNEQQRRTTNAYGITRSTLSDPAFSVVQAGFTQNNSAGNSFGENYLLSTFGRLNYNFNHKYYLAGTLRQDEYSGLGKKKGIFYGGSAGWEITQENFWKKAHLDNVFSSFKFRGSYGKVGNINGIGDYSPYTFYGSGLNGGLATLAFSTGQVGNPNLTWETSKQTDIGFNFGILKDRISGEIAYYRNNVDGLILNVAQSPSAGLPTNPPINVGSMYNKGLEITLNAIPIQNKDFSWNTSINLTINKNQVTALAPGLTNVQTGTSGTETVNETVVGKSEGYLWVVRSAGVDPATGKRIFVNGQGTKVYYQASPDNRNVPPNAKQFAWSTTPDGTTAYVSPTGATAINQASDAVLYKNTIPKYVGGWSNTFNYKAFSLDVLLTYQAGFYVYYGTNAGLHDQRFWNNATDILTDAWTAKGQVGAKYARPVFNDNTSNGSAIPMDINVFKGDFVKLRNVSLSYSLPRAVMEKLKVSSIRIYISGQNLGIKTKYPGPDPEVSSNGNSSSSQGVDRNTIANARTLTAGLNVGF